jgi:hypothetical protein
MTPYKLTIYPRPTDLVQFIGHPERPKDVVVTFKWQPDSGWPVALTINPSDFRLHDITESGASITFHSDKAVRSQILEVRAEFEKRYGKLE